MSCFKSKKNLCSSYQGRRNNSSWCTRLSPAPISACNRASSRTGSIGCPGSIVLTKETACVHTLAQSPLAPPSPGGAIVTTVAAVAERIGTIDDMRTPRRVFAHGELAVDASDVMVATVPHALPSKVALDLVVKKQLEFKTLERRTDSMLKRDGE